VTLDNAGKLPAGSSVDLLVLDKASPGGDLVVAAKGHVSADGAHVATDPGAGITEVTWLGVRPAAVTP
jgi:hypothetical protein